MTARPVLAALLLLAGCDQAGADGYAFERAEFVRSEPGITIVTHPTLAELRAAGTRAGAAVEAGHPLMAWSIIRPQSCEVHVVDPGVSYRPQWIGHEVAHCVWGRWHP